MKHAFNYMDFSFKAELFAFRCTFIWPLELLTLEPLTSAEPVWDT